MVDLPSRGLVTYSTSHVFLMYEITFKVKDGYDSMKKMTMDYKTQI